MFGFYAFCMLVLWKFGSALGDWNLQTKLLITIFAAPLIFVVVALQMNR